MHPASTSKASNESTKQISVRDYIRILDIFDGLAGIQRLKQAAVERCRLGPGRSVLDVGCGTGLETVRLAKLVAPSVAVLRGDE